MDYYYKEVEVQNMAAKSGFVVEVIDHEVQQYCKQIVGTEPTELKCF